MAIRQQLNFAELDYLLCEHHDWPVMRTWLGLDLTTRSTDVATAGLASLATRSLVRWEAGEPLVDDELIWLTAALMEPGKALVLSHVEGSRLNAAALTLGARPLLISFISPGCVELIALSETASAEDLASSVVRGNAGAAGALFASTGAGLHPLLIQHNEGGQWLIGGSDDVLREATDEGVTTALAGVIESAMSIT